MTEKLPKKEIDLHIYYKDIITQIHNDHKREIDKLKAEVERLRRE